MLDPKFIRENPDIVRQALKDRNDKFDLDAYLSLDEERRRLMRQIEELFALQNKIDAEMKIIIKERKDPASKIAEGREIKKQISELDKTFNELEVRFKDQLLRIPNVPHTSIPKGHPSNNKIIKEWGNKRKFDFKPLEHIAIAENLDIIDFKRATKISGSNFILFKGAGARLERALIGFMLDLHTQKHGFKEISPALLVNRDSMRATGQLPKLEEDMYRLKDDDFFLIPTAEVPVTNIHRDEVLHEEDLPIYYTAYTACFRREAGSYGKDTKGLTRVHQFDKVELVKFVKPQDSYNELEKLLVNACTVLELLDIPYRILELATGDISFAAAKCYDIEIYAPGIEKWLEVSSCSNFEDFQARRASIRYKEKETGKLKFVHTLNGSGVALARLVVAILENYQQADGAITIPEVLRPYMGGTEKIS
ncbi:MAG: serine--tRNA ligase [Candidatus Omnitrophica bacterium]|jgi:seryl-tRNA synthetase|nr:serine--tRNA ligase [Candidatus Omnitrophota bacterium]